ncbi:hypothetical protein, partial [Escherichia coli]
MKKLVATAPRVAALVEYEDRAILANEVKIGTVAKLAMRQPFVLFKGL